MAGNPAFHPHRPRGRTHRGRFFHSMRGFISSPLAGGLIFGIGVLSCLAWQPAAAREPIPAAAALAAAEARVRETHEDDFRAGESDPKPLVQKLLAAAEQSDDPAFDYALLLEAEKAAVAAGAVGLAMDAVDARADIRRDRGAPVRYVGDEGCGAGRRVDAERRVGARGKEARPEAVRARGDRAGRARARASFRGRRVDLGAFARTGASRRCGRPPPGSVPGRWAACAPARPPGAGAVRSSRRP